MELSQHGFLEELLAPRRETWSSLFPSELLIPTGGWNFDSLDHQENNPNLINPSFVGFSTTPTFDSCPLITDDHQPAYPFLDHGLISPVPAAENIDSSSISYTNNNNNNNNNNETQTTSSFLAQEDNNYYNPSSIVEQDEEDQLGGLGSTTSDNNNHHSTNTNQVFNMGLYNNNNGDDQRKIMSKAKKLEGQPSKNLMAERRRRKRLNDRLSMLRSIVPKISKMDRTSILGDTIDYMKELLERINKLQEEETLGHDVTNDQILMGKKKSKELKPNEVLVRNSPKFDVERREIDTRIDICCAAKPGLLLSTVNTLEAIGLEIQQCVISCFNDFSMQASCSEVGEEQRTLLSSEDIKQALFKNAGYGGRCL
ncbi:hypothetical protein LWI28_012555 [Acer negundo]|uniref:BHLH domain-containing protein n=1 Tax=Acer negundo TaxID=4023 RepID=A0AAD5IIC9_ACENE|nr:hypothetical protein LWI28_012555 [Acer negundo]